MFDPEQLLGKMIGGALGGALGGGGSRRRRRENSVFATGDIAGKAQLGVGLIGIAIAAYEHYAGNKNTAAPATGTATMPPPPPPPMATRAAPPPPPPAATSTAAPPTDQRQADMVLMVQAMIAAAAADGQIDEIERGNILRRADEAGLDAESRAFLERELAAPRRLEYIIGQSRPELAPDLYAASLIAISPDTEAEQRYLGRLAAALGIDDATRQNIHQQLGMA